MLSVLVAIVGAIVAVVTLVFQGGVPLGQKYTLNAVFQRATNVNAGNPVRIAGIDVGQVTSVTPVGGPSAPATKVTMSIDKAGRPIHADARLRVRQRNLLEGAVFLELQPGSPSAPELHSGQTIPAAQTSGTVQLDEILTGLQSDTRRSLQTLLKEASRALSQPGVRGFNRSIPYWEPAYRDSAVVSDAMLGLRTDDLSGFLRGGGQTARALDRDPVALRRLISGLAQTAEGFARNDEQLSDTWAELPRTLRVGMPALQAVNGSLPAFRRLVAAARPAMRAAAPALTAGVPLTEQLDRLVQPAELQGLARYLRRAMPGVTSLSRATVPLFEQVRLASSCQNEVIAPWSRSEVDDPDIPETGPVIEELPKGFSSVGEGRERDANGKVDHALVQGANYATVAEAGRYELTSVPVVGINPPAPKERPPYRDDLPCETQQPPDLRSHPNRPTGQRPVRPTNARIVRHYRDRYTERLLEQGGPGARQAADLLTRLLSPGGGFMGGGGR